MASAPGLGCQPKPEGAAAAMRMALRDAGMAPEEVGYVNAHGTGTQANNPAACTALRMVLEDGIAVSSTKSMHGHALGAALSNSFAFGGLNAVLAFRRA